ncbi:hypothetical protein IBL26_02895 [Roseomonas aerophila]|uniref:Uncharacterized protein n=1 Tax=Teichococcus aerophilus TaxID=1224513 RepID=A0ABR7RGS9_9PROT|nr:hypothetical protein [Pseudoroseomonas aerophila]MBC9205769.1 hypothetical protein [Pseudoroseomonas aerophila]
MRLARIAMVSTSLVLLPTMAGTAQARMPVPSMTSAEPGHHAPDDRYLQQEQPPRVHEVQQRQGGDAASPLDEAAKARVRERVRGLTPEYHRRAARDGQAAADAWIRQRGYEIGQDEGRRARQRQSGR